MNLNSEWRSCVAALPMVCQMGLGTRDQHEIKVGERYFYEVGAEKPTCSKCAPGRATGEKYYSSPYADLFKGIFG